MTHEKKYSDCRARLISGSANDLIVQALRRLHKKHGNYNFLDMEELKKELDEATRITLNDPENGNLDALQRMQIVEINLANDFKLRIHMDHWIPFSELK
ncbi:hypothetical protein KKG31_07600 [Patescibacteria group bacterium]|nr:hypothetical protein [Patescibacteria group bacterium]MBU1758932.1 hypothetical protein [Patescibacteria group bacterium]